MQSLPLFRRAVNAGLVGLAMACILQAGAAWAAPTCSDPNVIIGSGETCSSQISITSNPATVSISGGGTLSETTGNAIANSGTISSFQNDGSISNTRSTAGTYVANGVYSTGTITSLINTGTISGGSAASPGTGSASAIFLRSGGATTLLDNSGTLTGYYGVYYAVAIATLSNSGTINARANGVIGSTNGSITNLTNSGSISGGNGGITNSGSGSSSRISNINNAGTGTISGGYAGILSQGGVGASIGTIDNSGTIGGSGSYGIANFTNNTIGTITNTGSIYASTFGIANNGTGTITTLNNAQGSTNAHGALTYTGRLPTNYNIMLGNTASKYGQLSGTSVTGALTFGIYSGTVLSSRYTGVLQGLTASNVTGATTGTYNGQTYQLVLANGSTTIWDLLFPNWVPPVVGPDATNTLTSVQMNAGGLATMYNQQAAAYQAALSYDCRVYDQNNLCVSAGGRYTYAGPSPAANAQAGLVVLGYRPVRTFRVGAFADQSVNISTPSGFSQSKSSPMWGLYAKWHMNKDETGLGVQASAVTSASKLTVTRSQLTNTEAGSGSTQFDGQGYQLTTNYHQAVTDATAVVPYVGLRYTRINAGAYTENTTADVTAPLSYNAMAQNTFSVIAGLGVRSHLAEKLTGTASVGIQQNLNYSMGNYAGTSSISGLESFSVQMPGNVNSMATATAGVYYDIRKSERVGLNVLWQQQPFIATNTTTALATYTIGF